MSLLQQLNENANKIIAEQEVILENFDRFNGSIEATAEPLNEAATEWLATLRGVLGKGTLDPNKKQNASYILGALMALSNADLVDALDDKGDIGTVLYNASNKDNPQESKAAMKRLMQMGRHPSIKTFVAKAMAAMDDPKQSTKLIGQVQSKIDQTMRAKLAKEKGGATSATGGAGVGGSPERAA